MFKSWLKLFRVVNLPTVPGDVLAGVAAFSLAGNGYAPVWVAWAAGLSVLIYMFGLVDNDIVGAKADSGRPIPLGEISLKSAKIVRLVLLALVLILAPVAQLPREWYLPSLLLIFTILIYNRKKWPLVMGCCRGLNVGCGMAIAVGSSDAIWWDGRMLLPFAVAAVFTIYITAVTKYSEGEELDPAKKRRVGFLIGAHIYLQLLTLIVFTLLQPSIMPLMIAGAVLLVALRIMKRALPEVPAS